VTTPAQLHLALISHTNVGKTTLARTLIGVDVGEVRDDTHVTTQSESYRLLSTPLGDELQLWDTPGFGDSVRLYARLKLSGNPIGWFLSEVLDRYRDKPFWLSQQAVKTAREAADVVLYIVNSSEDPQDAGYLAPEMKILQWLGKPVVVLLNQLGPPQPFAAEQAEQARWQNHLATYPVVRQVLALDAYARCWVHERVFYAALAKLIPAEKAQGYGRLLLSWEQANEARFQASMQLIAAQLVAAALDAELIAGEGGVVKKKVLSFLGLGTQPGQSPQGKAMAKLTERLADSSVKTTVELLRLHHLDAGSVAEINELVASAFVATEPVSKPLASLWGAVSQGLLGGLAADVLAGGLSLGAGALIGAIGGAVAFWGAAEVFNVSTGRDASRVQFSDDFLRAQLIAGLLRYLAVIHFGRGRGKFVVSQAPSFWREQVDLAVGAHEAAIAQAFNTIRTSSPLSPSTAPLQAVLSQMASRILTALYPQPQAHGGQRAGSLG